MSQSKEWNQMKNQQQNNCFAQFKPKRINIKDLWLLSFILPYKNKLRQMEGDQFPFSDKYDWASKVFLGQGAFGKVFKVKNIKDNQFYAIKQMKMEQFNKQKMLMDSLKGEIQITMEVNSEHTVKMLDAKIGKKYTYIILQLCDIDLRKDLASRKYTQAECVNAFSEIMKGFSVLVGKGYIHRDVKPANTLIKNKRYKVSDFGFACKADILGKKKLNDICGTPLYMAPQLLKNQPYTAKSDIWSLALMFYEMLFGYPPWPCRSLKEYMNNIYTKPVPFPFDAKIGQNTKDFLQRALVVNEDKRISWAEVFNHPIIKGKQAGSVVKQVKVNVLAHGIILKFQQHCTKTNVNWMNIANKYSKQKIDLKTFKAMMSEIYQLFSNDEIEAIFNHLDSNKKGMIQWSTVENFLIKIDYRPHTDIFSRKIDQIAAIMRERKMDPSELFDKIDLNKSKSLDYEQFSAFIRAIAPCYSKQEISQIFKLFDLDRSGAISKNQFLQLFCKRLPGNKQEDAFLKQRVSRNFGLFKKYVKEHKMTAESILKLADKSNKKAVDMKEFTDLILNRFKIEISQEEIVELFAVMNKNKNNLVCIDQLTLAIK